MYQDPNNGGVDVFLRAEPEQVVGAAPEGEPPSSRTGGSGLLVLNILLVLLMLGGTIGVVWYFYQPKLQLSTPIEESLPFREAAAYLAGHDRVVAIVGPDARVRDAGDSVLDWSLAGDGYARIHVVLEGSDGRTEGFVEWERDRDAWLVKSANFLTPSGERKAIPLGSGTFLSDHDLAAWRAADGSTPVGRGQRELIQGRPFQAIQLFNDALEVDPEDTEALLWRGRSFESVGNYQKALADYQRILSFDETHAAALARLDALRASPPPGAPSLDKPERDDTPAPPPPTALIPED